MYKGGFLKGQLSRPFISTFVKVLLPYSFLRASWNKLFFSQGRSQWCRASLTVAGSQIQYSRAGQKDILTIMSR